MVTNARILVVDDEKGVVRSCVRILQRQGFIVSGRTDSLSVPDLLRQEAFDLLLTDIKMPKLDGLELLRIAKQIDPHITVVLITGYGTMEDAIKAIRLGAQGFIMKPFEPDELIATVQESLARRALLRDSLRLQTLLPLLELNQILQVSGGETLLLRQALEIAQRATNAARIAWLSCPLLPPPFLQPAAPAEKTKDWLEMALAPQQDPPPSHLPPTAVQSALTRFQPLWVLSDGTLIENLDGQPNVIGALLPLLIKGEVVGLLTAEAGRSPFNQISLDLLAVIAGQLAVILENVQLFQQTETLHTFNKDIIQTMTNGLIAIDQQGTLTALNPAAAKMLGSQPEDALSQPLRQVISGELTEIFQQTLTTGFPAPRRETILKSADGSQRPISISTAPLAGHPPTGVVGVLEDLSEIKALEEERRRLDRLAVLGEMSAVVAHEIRNPIAGIAAGVEYLTRNTTPGTPEFQGATMIQHEIERVNRILEDILFVARPLKLNLSLQNLPDIIEDVLQRCRPQLEAGGVSVSVEYLTPPPPLELDRQRLEQVLTNLIINAIQAMRHGGQLTLQTNLVRTPNGAEPKNVTLTISDTGPGIAPDTRRRIFEPFFTTKARGTGLGLAVARRIIEEHHGTVSIHSEEAKGSSFIIQLPLERDPRENLRL
jgi:PAS domain S-box-containing protein